MISIQKITKKQLFQNEKIYINLDEGYILERNVFGKSYFFGVLKIKLLGYNLFCILNFFKIAVC